MLSLSSSKILIGCSVLALLVGFKFPSLSDFQPSIDNTPQATEKNLIDLGGVSFDPAKGLPLFNGKWGSSLKQGQDLRLIQFDGPIKEDWVKSLEENNIRIIQYIHPNSYVVWSDKNSVKRFKHENIRASLDFIPAFRVQTKWHNLGPETIKCKALLYKGADTKEIINNCRLQNVNIIDHYTVDDRFEMITFTIRGENLSDFASISGVYAAHLQPTDGGLRTEMASQVNVENYDLNGNVFPGYQDWLNAQGGIDGREVIVAVVDGGVDQNHGDLAGRFEPCFGDSCTTGSSSHGTHCAGIIGGNGSTGVTDSYGFLRGLGVAPGCQFLNQQYSPWFTQANGMRLIIETSASNGALLSGNSWGPSGSPQGYDMDTMLCDLGVRDAIENQPGNQEFTYVLSIMNGNGGTSSQGSPDEAKNIFTIGSTKLQTGSGSQDDIFDISSNSAHGPCLDGRIIPHMVAPGCQVDSTYPNGSYGLSCGTSMASPQVTGAIALFIEKYKEMFGTNASPSPALVKATFLPVALSLSGNGDADGGLLGHPFDNKQGWGRLALGPILRASELNTRFYDQEVLFDSTGDEWEVIVSPLNPQEPVKMMLVWTDAPGHGLGGSTPAWNNDLDLIVEAGGQTYLGNNFGNNGWSITNGNKDSRNNTEGVFLGPNPPSTIKVRVVASNINSDGVPNVGDSTDQDFALVIYNGAQEPGFALEVENNNFEICAPGSINTTINIEDILGFDEEITLNIPSPPSGFIVTLDTPTVIPPATVNMSISTNILNPPSGLNEILIEATSGNIYRSISTSVLAASNNPEPFNLISPSNNSLDIPLSPTFNWNQSEYSMEYDLLINDTPDFANPLFSYTTTDTALTIEDSLVYNSTYYWKVSAKNPCDNISSNIYTFVTSDIPPYPDDCSSASIVSNGTYDISTLDATNSTEPYSDDQCGGTYLGEMNQDIWLNYEACESGPITVSTCNSVDFDTDLVLYTGTCNDLAQISCNGDGSGCAGYSSVLEANVEKGRKYLIRVGGWASNSSGTGTIEISGPEGICKTKCPTDLNGDGTINTLDLLGVVSAFGTCADCPQDFNGDGLVNTLDLLQVVSAFGSCE